MFDKLLYNKTKLCHDCQPVNNTSLRKQIENSRIMSLEIVHLHHQFCRSKALTWLKSNIESNGLVSGLATMRSIGMYSSVNSLIGFWRSWTSHQCIWLCMVFGILHVTYHCHDIKVKSNWIWCKRFDLEILEELSQPYGSVICWWSYNEFNFHC